ncbi:class A beta-lactamase [Kitasatospora sp. NPDC093806]|uniref:class A beta-lactamase n=1 Tax=Kitasatospora sp. NPDC093806 TaxID=3155075 RepID=UPI003419CC37
MTSIDPRPRRRRLLGGAAAAALGTVLTSAEQASARGTGADGGDVTARLRALERAHAARLGVAAHDTVTGRTVLYRADEPFPMCSTFKTFAVAAVLRDLDRDDNQDTHQDAHQETDFLAKRLRYTEQDVTESGYAPITGLPANLAGGLTVEELCAAAIEYSDNAAANLLLREIGGPTAVTRFCRSLGDRVTRLDHWEPALNSAEPDRESDTSSPRALARGYARLIVGDALDTADRRRLTGWLLRNTTGGHRLRAGLPDGWTVAEKTGTGRYGTTNDVGVAWPPGHGPIAMAVLSTKSDPAAPADEPLLAEAAAILATALRRPWNPLPSST